jgi:ABC-type multidrug transport system ATPase subunit
MAQSARDLILKRKRKVHILSHIDGVLEAGEMLVVLGPPGSGCTSLLKALSGERNGIYVEEKSELNYNGTFHISLRADNEVFRIKTSEVVTEVKPSTLPRSMFTSLSSPLVKPYSKD